MMLQRTIAVFLVLAVAYAANIIVNGKDTERMFYGIGGLSAGASSRLLVDYEEPYRSQILDYLFKPNFGASLHILKVEIGGDTQSTDGTESSHMHFKEDLNFKRGYEFWLLVEAKKRNPDITTYALSWGVPGWIGDYFSQDNIDYQVKWLQGVKANYNIEIDYIGIWNERPYQVDYIINLSKAITAAGLKTKIVAADSAGNKWKIVEDMKSNPELKEAVDVVGVHYPGTTSTPDAVALGTPLWSSEDYSTHSNNVGSGCWARILNQNYVNGYMTSTISWSLIAAWDPGFPYKGDGLMWSWWPWSGSYVVSGTIWGSAHTTQFTKPGWKYLKHGSGVGHLPEGGSVVTLVPPEANGDFTMVIETMTHDNSLCIRPHLPPYEVKPQNVTFQLEGLKSDEPLNVWYSHFSANESQVVYFKHSTVMPKNGEITMQLGLDELITVTTMSGGAKGSYGTPPPAKSFPDKWSDNFESYPEFQEGKYFMDQTGVWEIYKSSKGNTMRQVVPEPPIKWCTESSQPITLIGDNTWRDMTVEFDALIESKGNIVAGARVGYGGCSESYNNGYFFKISVTGAWSILSGVETLKSGTLSFGTNKWHNIRLNVTSSTVSAYVDNNLIGTVNSSSYNNGWAAVGSSFDYTQFDNFVLTHAT